MVCRYNLALGTEWHTAHWHGNTVVWRDTRSDVIPLGPASLEVRALALRAAASMRAHTKLLAQQCLLCRPRVR